jgi:hypothetical protein
MGILSWFGHTRYPEEPGWLRRWLVLGRGQDDANLAKIKRAAAEDVAEMEQEGRAYFNEEPEDRREDF